MNEKGETKGYCFLEFPNHRDAVEAVKTTNNYKLDKSHTFVVNLFSDFEKYENIPTEWEPPVEEPFIDQGSRKSHLLEPDACDQYALVYKGGEEVAVHQNSVRGLGEPKELQVRSRWTETYVKWSPLGSYLATCHRMGKFLSEKETYNWDNFGMPKWELVLCLLGAWLLVCLSLIKGVKSSGKVK